MTWRYRALYPSCADLKALVSPTLSRSEEPVCLDSQQICWWEGKLCLKHIRSNLMYPHWCAKESILCIQITGVDLKKQNAAMASHGDM